jgi:hypothetical protein
MVSLTDDYKVVSLVGSLVQKRDVSMAASSVYGKDCEMVEQMVDLMVLMMGKKMVF